MTTTGNIILGFNLLCLSAIAAGTFALFLNKMRTYKLEQMWSLSFLIGYLVIPIGILSLVLPSWPTLLTPLQGKIIPIILMGTGWGIGSLFFINGIKNMGLASGSAIIFGVAIALGALFPLMRKWDSISGFSQLLLIFGICICIAGVTIVSIAAGKKENIKCSGQDSGKTLNPSKGIAGCFVSGALSACSNIGYDLTEPVLIAAGEPGIDLIWISVVRWIPLYISAFSLVLCYSVIKITRNRSWRNFIMPGARHDLLIILVIGVLLTVGQIPYGAATIYLGKLGTSAGWAVYISLTVIVANIGGFLRGEWKAAPRRLFWVLICGIGVLISGVIIIAIGNNLFNNF